ncbi:hypothetical protein Arcpr_1171 [Archaeoglobus profundus DSM 5631]|uniref:Uncharacterized protein n=1 Tax=Archaeoglobus profundus (strain DSM 5631 / JCM 9629 / NBRC 100127 / Av18) TaxID=572546 RepID=D2RDN1_ARCPA|nr:hypothetical protein Arcpr_1171 [Archaeoglobus profundus DSM 5631]
MVIPEEVKVEVVDKGKELEKADAYVVERAIEEGWIKVVKTELIDVPIKLHPGGKSGSIACEEAWSEGSPSR